MISNRNHAILGQIEALFIDGRGGRVVRWCLVNFQCRGILLIWIIVGHGLLRLQQVRAGVCSDIFSLVYHHFLSLLFLPLSGRRPDID